MNNINNDKEEFKYICEKCDYKCRFDCEWKKHCKTTLHITGKRKKKDNYKQAEKCKFCNYMTKNTFLLKKHTLTEHSTKEERKEKFTYYCDLCDFGTFSKDTHEIHLNTNKHKRYNVIN